MSQAYSLYLHIPFCKHRCAYCDFNTYAGQEDSIPAYVDALCKEIEFVGRNLPSPKRRGAGGEVAHTIFFGGGTPSLLSPQQFEKILRAIRDQFELSDAEITVEANPGTVSYEALCQLRALGINRISFGAQSANSEELHMLERAHNFFDVIEAVTSARKAGFDNLNLDLIYGLPEQTLQTWQSTVKRIFDLQPEHISAYALTIEHGTPFGRWSLKGLLSLPNPDLAADMYEWTMDFLEENGYVQYEISNWARLKDKGGRLVLSDVEGMKDEIKTRSDSSFILHNSSFACRHNLQYWRGLPYLAFGAGGHGYADGYRYSNVIRIKTYIDRLANYELRNTHYKFPLTPATVNHHKQTAADDMGEFMMTGLRLTRDGVSSAAFYQRFGRGLIEVYPKEIDELVRFGLLEWKKEMSETFRASDILRLTSRGRLLGNQVFLRFIE
jgi:oxygen-independent coproporphyrinogen-3 oxidase